MPRSATDRQLLALRPAIAAVLECLTRDGSNEDWLKAARPLLGPLIASNRPSARRARSTGAKRGPKVRFDAEWAHGVLLDLTIADPDGLPDNQSEMCRWLATRYEIERRPKPSASWIQKTVSAFYRKAHAHEADARERFGASPELQRAFEYEEVYLQHVRGRVRLEQIYAQSPQLRAAFPTVAAYVDSLMPSAQVSDLDAA